VVLVEVVAEEAADAVVVAVEDLAEADAVEDRPVVAAVVVDVTVVDGVEAAVVVEVVTVVDEDEVVVVEGVTVVEVADGVA
jgi:hypothetical protein